MLNPASIDVYDTAAPTKSQPKNTIKKKVMELFEEMDTHKHTDVIQHENESFDEFKPVGTQTQRAIAAKQPKPPQDNGITTEEFTALKPPQQPSQYRPYYSNPSSTYIDQHGQLLQRMNHMISLLEEQQEERTEHVVEELILYSFLGIFTIFMIDGFARVGKYSR
jgi:hypothetical protein